MLLFINEIDFKAFGPFNDVDGTDVKLFRAMFKSYKQKHTHTIQLIELKYFFSSEYKTNNNIAREFRSETLAIMLATVANIKLYDSCVNLKIHWISLTVLMPNVL